MEIIDQLVSIYQDDTITYWHDDKLSVKDSFRYYRNIMNKGRLLTITTEGKLIGYLESWRVSFEQISGVAAPTDGVPTGTMVAYGGATAPSNWLLCYGQAVSRTTYSDLFGIISTSYGVGDGSTTFNLPDMRGRVPLGKDNMGGASANRVVAASADSVGGTGGRSTQYNHSHNSAASAAGAGFTAYNSTTITDDTTDANIQPYQTHNYIIKT